MGLNTKKRHGIVMKGGSERQESTERHGGIHIGCQGHIMKGREGEKVIQARDRFNFS
jgi:hypothetical protein